MQTVDISQFSPAEFRNKECFLHFSDPDHPGCFVCNSRMYLVRPLLVDEHIIVLEATTRLDNGDFVIIPNTWLIYPRQHTEGDLPDDWTAHCKRAVRFLGIQGAYNVSTNYGAGAGQTVQHAHSWIYTRDEEAEMGLISHRTGPATTLLRIRQHAIRMP